MGRFLAILLLCGAGYGVAQAAPVPLPRPRPHVSPPPVLQSFADTMKSLGVDPSQVSAAPTPCDQRLAGMAAFEPLPWLIGPGLCGGRDMVELKSVLLADGVRVAIRPASVLRCAMAAELAAWIRDAAAPNVKKAGGALRAVDTYDDYECRSRNRISGAKISEHGKGNAVDVRAFTLAGGRVIRLTDPTVDKHLREGLRDAACRDFTTVLGPGADPYHAEHIHLDLIARHNGYRICEWDVRVPVSAAKPGESVKVPLPRPRPAAAAIKHAGRL